jgi:Flp pilus assembly pilin Flp
MNRLLRFLKDPCGTSALEFGLTAPLLGMALVGLLETGSLGYQRSDMHTAARAGTQYFMSGGSDFDRAREVVIDAWDNMPEDATVVVSPYCLCGAAAAQCFELCPDDSAPDMYARFQMTGSIGLSLTESSETKTELVRVR